MKDEYIIIGEVTNENEDGSLDVRLYPPGSTALDIAKGGRFLTLRSNVPVFGGRNEFIG